MLLNGYENTSVQSVLTVGAHPCPTLQNYIFEDQVSSMNNTVA
jgi:hypothetical protein